MTEEIKMFRPGFLIVACLLAAMALAGGCGKKEEKAPAAVQPPPMRVINLIDETKRSAEATGTFSQVPGMLDQLATHMEAKDQARQQGADTSPVDAQIANDVMQLEQIQNSMAGSQPDGEKKPELDRLNENLTKLIQAVRQGQELKAMLKPPKDTGGFQADAGATGGADGGFTQSGDSQVASAENPNPAGFETSPAADANSPGTPTGDSAAVESGMKAESREQPALAATRPPLEKPGKAGSSASCCTLVLNPEMKGRLGRLVVDYPKGTSTDARIGVLKDDKEVSSGYGNKGFDLFPGSYSVVISGKRVDNVTVQSGHDTKVKVGVLRVSASGNTRIGVLDQDGKTEIASGYGKKEFGLPIGTVHVKISGHAEAVNIQEGKITDF